jgi:hypothetical protein
MPPRPTPDYIFCLIFLSVKLPVLSLALDGESPFWGTKHVKPFWRILRALGRPAIPLINP